MFKTALECNLDAQPIEIVHLHFYSKLHRTLSYLQSSSEY